MGNYLGPATGELPWPRWPYSGYIPWPSTVTTFDQTAHTIVVKGKEGEKTFDVSQATMKGQIEPEHYVAVKYTETNGKMVASSVMAVSHKVSSNMKKLSSAGNALYSGIGDAMIWGWVTSKSCSA